MKFKWFILGNFTQLTSTSWSVYTVWREPLRSLYGNLRGRRNNYNGRAIESYISLGVHFGRSVLLVAFYSTRVPSRAIQCYCDLSDRNWQSLAHNKPRLETICGPLSCALGNGKCFRAESSLCYIYLSEKRLYFVFICGQNL